MDPESRAWPGLLSLRPSAASNVESAARRWINRSHWPRSMPLNRRGTEPAAHYLSIYRAASGTSCSFSELQVLNLVAGAADPGPLPWLQRPTVAC
jgi:hypothetical protein